MARKRETHGYGRVALRKQGKYYHARFTYKGQRHYEALKVTTLEAAEKIAREINDLVERGEYTKLRNRERGKTISFGEMLDRYLSRGCRWSDSTRRQNASMVAALRREFGDYSVLEIEAHEIEGYIARLVDDGKKRTSCNRHLSVLKQVFKKAMEWGYLPHDPTSGVKQFREAKKMPNPFRDDEIEALKRQLSPKHRNILTVYLETGLRRGELTGLEWKDVSFEGNGSITVRDPKNDEDREIPLSQSVRKVLQERKAGPVVNLKYVFGTSGDILQVLGRAARDCLEEGRKDRLQHRLRDTFGTKLADGGVPLDRIQTLMGHKTVAMTRKYVQTREQGLRDAIATTFN